MMAALAKQYRSFLLLMALTVAVLVTTKPEHYGDSPVYADDIRVAERGGPFPPGKNPLWEFGHVLWRPIGRVMWHAVAAAPALRARYDDRLLIYLGLIAVSVAGGVAAVTAMHGVARVVLGATLLAYIPPLAMLLTHAFLNYWQTGSAYQPGLGCVTVSLYLVYRAANAGAPRARDAILAGAILGVGVCLWLPYVFSAPAIALAAACWGPGGMSFEWARLRERLRFLRWLTGACVMVGILCYGVAIRQNQIGSVKALVAWGGEASHEMAQTKHLLRLPMGLPRSFIHMGEDGMMYKRYLLKDPYAPVRIGDLLRGSLIKIALFYLGVSGMLALLWRRRETRGVLVLLAAGCVPVIVFAVTLFEPGQPDRYLPMYPFFFLAMAHALSPRQGGHWWLRAALVVLVTAAAGVNLNAMASLDPEARYREAFERQRALARVLRPNSVVVTVNYRDDLSYALARFPFHEALRPPLPLWEATEGGTFRARVWPSLFARKAMEVWSKGGDVWISKRVVAERPHPSWRWVEGDDPYLRWADLPRFFRPLEWAGEVGGEDGFFLAAPSEKNRRFLEAHVQPDAGAGGE